MAEHTDSCTAERTDKQCVTIKISDNGKENFERGFQHSKRRSRKNNPDGFGSKLPTLCERL